ncbi:MAG: hypothetical protein R3335_12715 [Anaerolineales bacterium]|nr:hypothetical protein [Anaerolineales bacterium]
MNTDTKLSAPAESASDISPRDASNWAQPVDRLALGQVPKEAVNINVKGRALTGPQQGFGQMWQKTYKVRLAGADCSPEEVIRVWKENFPSFWPEYNKFYGPQSGIRPGEVALINTLGPADSPLMSTGVMVIYADEVSFTFMTPEGHPFSGWVTFSSYVEEESTVAQAQVLIRATDPLYELGFRLGFMHKGEDRIWHHTLLALSDYFRVEGSVQQSVSLVDPRVQWSKAGNVWKNSGIRTMLYTPIALARRLAR